jgi:hypothetical protein
MRKFALAFAVITLTACGASNDAAETTADSTAVVIDTVNVVADSTAAVDSTAK